MTDPRNTPVHLAAKALDRLATIHARKLAAVKSATERIDEKYRRQLDAVLEELPPEALDMVKAQVGGC